MAGSYIKKATAHSGLYAIGNIARQLVGFIMLPVYTQYLSPSDYGIIGLMIFAINLIDIVFGARLVGAVPKFYYPLKEKGQERFVISTALLQTSAISLITMIVVILLREPFSETLFEKPDYALIVGIFAVTILTQAVENYGLLYIRLQEKPGLFLTVNLCKLAVQLFLNIWFIIFLDLGIIGIALANAISSILFATILSVRTLLKTGVYYEKKIGWEMICFCWPLWLAGLAALYVGSSNRYYMSLFSTLDDIGLYELAVKFSGIITLLIWRPFNMFWQTERFKFYEKGKPAPNIYRNVFLVASTFLVIAGLGISLFSEAIIQIMSSPSYHPAAKAVPYLVLGAIFNALLTFFNFSLLATDNTKLIGKNNYLTAFWATLAYIVMIPALGYVGAAIGLCITYCIQMLNMFRISKKYYDTHIKLFHLFSIIGIGAIGCYLSKSVFDQTSMVHDVIVNIIIFIVFSIIIISLTLFDTSARQYAFDLLEKFKNRKKQRN